MFALTIFKFIGRITGITDLINMAGVAANTALQAAIDNAITPALDALKALPADIQAAIAKMVSEFKDELKAIVVEGLRAGAEKAVIDAALNAAQASFWTRFTQAAAGTAAQGAAQAAAMAAARRADGNDDAENLERAADQRRRARRAHRIISPF